MRFRFLLRAVFVLGLLAVSLRAQVPQLISYQGRVAVSGTNFSGTGTFNFALVNATGSTTYWTNDGTNLNGAQPSTGVSLAVANGLYTVLLGDTTITNMTAIPASVFSNSDVRLRVWFNDGTHGAQLLVPDQRIASVGYAIVAGSVSNGAIGLPQLGLGTISGSILCNATDPTHTYVYLRGTNSLAYVGAISSGSYPFLLTLVPPGSYTLVAHHSNGDEVTTPVTVTAGQTLSGVTLGGATTTDPNNCGACGNVCTAGTNATPSCVAGACVVACNGGYTNCSGTCTSVATSVTNCGACGNVCTAVTNATPTCTAGVCVVACNGGYTNCSGTCTSVTSDLNNCGSCGNTCPSVNNGVAACVSGACSGFCNAGYADCNFNPADGCETNLTNNVQNCGACGNTCATSHDTAACVSSTCTVGTCNAGYANCNGIASDGCEINTVSDVNHCGSCATVCSTNNSTPSCVSGLCTVGTCNTGFGNCDGSAANGCETNLQNTYSNCGSCGHSCTGSQTCTAGVCI